MGHGCRAGGRGQGEGRRLNVANLLYLIGAVVVSAVACLLVWLRNRKPKSVESAIDSFQRELRALSPDRHPGDREGRNSG